MTKNHRERTMYVDPVLEIRELQRRVNESLKRAARSGRFGF